MLSNYYPKTSSFKDEIKLCKEALKYRNAKTKKFLYSQQLQNVANRNSEILEIYLDDIANIISYDFARRIENNIIRYINLFCTAIDSLLPEPTIELTDKTRSDIYLRARLSSIPRNISPLEDERKKIPSDLIRRYELIIHTFKASKIKSVRTIKSKDIGKLIKIIGLVTRITNVKPLLYVATYACDACGHEFYKTIRSRQFTPLFTCENPNCTSSEKIHMQTRASKFLSYQQLTIQETPDQVPYGNIPRTMNINLRSSSVKKCVSGDLVSVTGVFLPVQYSGFKALKSGLTSSTIFEAIHLNKMKKGYNYKEKDEKILKSISILSKDPECYQKLSSSIAPEIYGLTDVKKALLLLMVGGPTKVLSDNLKIRGDINIILMGDPGVAKSQLLKHISTIAPRAIYTTGKGSSGVGLTAAVLRDPSTNEMVLEGGALVMADMGICCIDEFDKMEDKDRTAIHEVMEQQTVSLSKGGICTTLNARTSILAAANPAFGRYDKKKSPEANILLPAALMSRFDLMFVLVDNANSSKDLDLAKHVCFVHKNSRHPLKEFDVLEPSFIRSYIRVARTYNPVIPKTLRENVIGIYLQMRLEGKSNESKQLMPTPRTLLSILRLSQALARIRLSNEVNESDLQEATRLMYTAGASMRNKEEEQTIKSDVMTRIYTTIKEYMEIREVESVKLEDIRNTLKIKGFMVDKINETLEYYQKLDVWMVNKAKTKLTLVS